MQLNTFTVSRDEKVALIGQKQRGFMGTLQALSNSQWREKKDSEIEPLSEVEHYMKVQSEALKSLQFKPEGHSQGHDFAWFSLFEVSPSIPHLIKKSFPKAKGDQFMKESLTLCGFSLSVVEWNCFRSSQIPVNTSRPAPVSRFGLFTSGGDMTESRKKVD